MNRESGIAVRELLSESAAQLKLTLRAGAAGLGRRITYPRIQKAALAVTGHVDAVREGRVQVLGSSEMTYLETQKPRKRLAIFRKVCARAPVTCFVITRGLEPPVELLQEAEEYQIPVLTTPLASSICIDQLQRFLDDCLAPRTTVHGVLIDVYGLGVLLLGESGIGKSECALDLVTRGHRFVCDDMVEIRRESDQVLVGSGPELGRHYIEIRGLGVVSVSDLFGISAIRNRKFIEMVCLLEPWQKGKAYDRLGLEDATYAILGMQIPLVRMPVAPGRNLAMLIEVAVRNQLLKLRGFHTARRFVDSVGRAIGAERPRDPDPDAQEAEHEGPGQHDADTPAGGPLTDPSRPSTE